MGTEIGPLAVRRSIWIDAPPERVWEEFEGLEPMRRWFGTGHTLVRYEPRVGAEVETDAGRLDDEALRFVGRVVVFDPPRELTFEQDWVGHGWKAPPLVTIRLTALDGGTRWWSCSTTASKWWARKLPRTIVASRAGGPCCNWRPSANASSADRIFGALADPTRRAILELLREHRSLPAGAIAARCPDISRPTVSKHFPCLRDARLVRAEERGRENHYTLDAAAPW